jgi:4-amino-4-deoxy-L-arabinose transferase-like glycosyltransferase
VLAFLYASETPFMKPGYLMHQRTPEGMPQPIIDVGAPDELQHINYVKYVAEGKGIPVLDPKDPLLGERYQSHQPPTYYLLAAGWSKVFGFSATGMRLLNNIIGGVAVLGIFFLAWWGLRDGPVAVGAAAFASLLPMNVALSSAVTNDPLSYCLCAWTLALTARSFREQMTFKQALLLGVVMGFAFISKTTSLAVLPAVALAFFMSPVRPGKKELGTAFALAFAIASVWWVRNTMVYGDPLAMGAFKEAFVNSPSADFFISSFGAFDYWTKWVAWWTLRSFVGMFGYMDIWLPGLLYPIALFIMLILGTFGALAAAKEREEKATKSFHLMNLVFFVVVILFFIGFNKTYFQGQARYVIPALGPIAIAISLGLCRLAEKKEPAAIGVLAFSMLCLNVYVLGILPHEFALRMGQTT